MATLYCPVLITMESEDANFVQSDTFQGARSGWRSVAAGGDDGRVGYWVDSGSSAPSQIRSKRKRGEMEEECISALGPDLILDVQSAKSLLLNLDRAITRNENDRLKHEGKPALFVDSEVELHASVHELHALAASPQYFALITGHAKGQTLTRCVQLLCHANSSIVAGVLTLIAEMSEVNADGPEEDTALILDFLSELLRRNMLELIISGLNTFDWKQEYLGGNNLISFDDDTEKGVVAALQLFENVMEILRGDLEEVVGGHEGLSQTSNLFADSLKNSAVGLADALSSILGKVRGFHHLKLHASENLSCLLSLRVEAEKSLASRVSEKSGQVEEVLDRLLQSQAGYRKKAPSSVEEEEFYLNLTLCISTMCRDEPLCKAALVDLQGIDLQLLILKEFKGSVNAQGALQVLRFASSGGSEAVGVAAVEGGALKHAWPFLMGSRALNLKRQEKDVILEHAITFCSQLVSSLHSCTKADSCYRLAAKFKEGESKKLKRVCSLFVRFHAKVQEAEQELEERVQAQKEQVAQVRQAIGATSSASGASAQLLDTEEMKLEVLKNEEVQYASRLQSGLETLQHLAVLVCFGVLTDPSHVHVAREVLSLSAVAAVIREMCAFITDEMQRKHLVGWLAKLQSVSGGE